MEPSPNWHICNSTPTPQGWGSPRKREWKTLKSQRMGKFAVRLCQKLHPLKSHQYDCLNLSRAKITPNGMLAWIGETSRRPQPHTNNYRQARNTESGRGRLLQKTAHGLVSQFQVVNLERIHTSTTIQIQQIVFMHL